MPKLSDRVCQRRPLVVLLGPTAVGKSRFGVQVAQHFGTEVLTADSRQVYRGMDIGTDKPTADERQGVPHRLIDLADPDETFNTGWYRRAALAEIDRLYAENQLPFVVGGTGLYIRTLVRGLCPAPPADPEVRAELMQMSQEQGRDRLHAELIRVDPETAARLHPNDEAKVMRALEVYRLSGQPMSAVQRDHGFQDAPFSALLIGLQRSKGELYRRIEERIDWQLAHGMVQETRALLDRGYRRDGGAMTGLGYRHVAAHVSGECDYAEMVRLFKRDTRRFAKRQMTWFRKEPGVHWISVERDEPFERIVRRIVSLIEQFLGTLEPGVMQTITMGKGQI
ncbi:MAG: tRNA (adenosine(37)-N6)-dimethylallyltransferase MiaA [Nitrospiraceae bacterium]|jgi:tRNA dimethylallyltransferase|uniref:tRNA (adenosine(37)-N6)-dimethylallyltransferase MiaA n=1 Tax=Nitrospira cf. moscoviensis SBR1015 TaxID=96242 RepID=UPI000A0BDACF|nr:tRNA (adenosine(37)-N6)-dimethylallyltransferase MiaA [Nitrospira cf. moscoviensis SBR1015]MBY0248627.1 tRNA (adenosine(37)-N6)-dimethylallyltransferase MiaA [Nitrospiraceae bacterium]OQW37691.1 MAG: tRNA (adenosine(37)-N6)-dimethylallyltransferase MiaA [Nitrospira sp. SG-bin2]